jgi:hypothetical protein
LPGGELIGPYLDALAAQLGALAARAAAALQPATIVYGRGRCGLAAHRDYLDAASGRFVCGLNPAGPADDTLLVARVTADDGGTLGTVINYACHPTTLAWQNTLLSPDYVGAMREAVRQQFAGPCLFLQGASADLGPREGFVGDPAVADRNGRQLGHAALAALESLPPPGTVFRYRGPVVSGATLGVWAHEPVDDAARHGHARWHVEQWMIPLTYRPELPTLDRAAAEKSYWQAAEQQAIAAHDAATARDCRARVEQAERQLWRLRALAPDHFPLPVTLARLGDTAWLFIAGEHYQALQTTLRARFPGMPIAVSTITGGWQPGYVPPAELYGRGIYQEQIAVVAAGSAEQILQAVTDRLVLQAAANRPKNTGSGD